MRDKSSGLWATIQLMFLLCSNAGHADSILKKADLVLENVSLSPVQVAGVGSAVQVSYQVRNIGTQVAGPSDLRFSYGDTTSTSGLTTLHTRNLAALGIGGMVSLNDTLVLPAGVLAGTRRIHWFVDAADLVDEFKENNNKGSTPVTIAGLPDLQIAGLAVSPAMVMPGQQVAVSFQVINAGVSRADPPHSARVYFSSDSSITTGDTSMGCLSAVTTSLDAGATTTTYSCKVTIPSGAAVGTWYIGVIPDHSNKVQESDEVDNSGYWQQVTVGLPDLELGYAALDTSSVPGHPSQTKVTFRVANNEAMPAGPFVVRFYYGDSAATTGLVLLGSHSVSGLPAKVSTADQTLTLTMPATVLQGWRYVHYHVDAAGAVVESNENNNRGHLSLLITGPPDLQITALAVSPTTIGPGQAMSISYRLRNDGPSRAAGPFVTRFYHSTDGAITAQDTYLGQQVSLISIPAHTNYPAAANGVVSATLPTSVGFGPGHIGAITDPDGVVPESQENNNTRSTVIVVGYVAGSPCSGGVQCPSGFCVDGVCCDTACGGGVTTDCQACSVAAGAAKNGVCSPLPSSRVCRAAAGGCDAAEKCSGTSTLCPVDSLKASGAVCRAAAGGCDVAEICSGSSVVCPSNKLVSAGTSCRPVTGVCDLPELCSGSAAACPADAFKPVTTICRAADGGCDQAETCSGSSAGCPADALKLAAAICRVAVGACDQAETCSGSSSICPPDGVAPAKTVCRAVVGDCDLPETCDGIGVTCPADLFRPDGEPCNSTGSCLGGVCVGQAQDAEADAWDGGIDAVTSDSVAETGPEPVPDGAAEAGLDLSVDGQSADQGAGWSDGAAGADNGAAGVDSGCSCRVTGVPSNGVPMLLGLLPCLFVWVRRRRRADRRRAARD